MGVLREDNSCRWFEGGKKTDKEVNLEGTTIFSVRNGEEINCDRDSNNRKIYSRNTRSHILPSIVVDYMRVCLFHRIIKDRWQKKIFISYSIDCAWYLAEFTD